MDLLFYQLKKNLKQDFSTLRKVNVSLMGDTATQFLAQSIRGMGYEYKLDLQIWEAEFNQIENQLFDPTSHYNSIESQVTIIFESSHKLLQKFFAESPQNRIHFAEHKIERLKNICKNTKGKLIYFNYTEVDDKVFGSYSNKIEQSFIYQLRKLNMLLMELAIELDNLYIADLSSVQNKIGRDTLFTPSVYVLTEMVLSVEALPMVSDAVVAIIASMQGVFKKCLILDLDNTVWGGVIGDDGLENIQIGHSLGIGKAFSEFQRWAKKLQQRGVILAVCSKNTESIAKEPFEKHPDMVLSLDDIAVFIANWDNKADNIRKIQSILNIGFDSMVFLDDNPVERAIVRENLPEVCVPELPEDPANYLEYLYGLNLFETTSFSAEDKDRTKQYKVEAERVCEQAKFTNEQDFLKTLEMVSVVEPFTSFTVPRVAQLSQRSNQFNLRTIRYTEQEVKAISQNPDYITFSFTLVDKYGDNGLICAVILKRCDNKTLFVDTWFMSCRVLKRGMERFTLNTIADWAANNGFERIVGEYIATPKNEMVRNHYSSLGFLPLVDGKFGLDVESYIPEIVYITKK